MCFSQSRIGPTLPGSIRLRSLSTCPKNCNFVARKIIFKIIIFVLRESVDLDIQNILETNNLFKMFSILSTVLESTVSPDAVTSGVVGDLGPTKLSK